MRDIFLKYTLKLIKPGQLFDDNSTLTRCVPVHFYPGMFLYYSYSANIL